MVRSFMDRRKFKKKKKKALSGRVIRIFKVGGNCEAMAGCKL